MSSEVETSLAILADEGTDHLPSSHKDTGRQTTPFGMTDGRAAYKFCDALSGKGAGENGTRGRARRAIADRTLGRGSIAGDEYLCDMQMARVNAKGEAHWVETCFCDPPLEEERPYWEKYFDLLSVKDAHSRRNCRHENGSERWACCDCDCTKRLEERLAQTGKSFLQELPSLSL